MIAYLKGAVKLKGSNFLILENQGVGYKIFTPTESLLKAKEGAEVEFYIYQHIREDMNQLYGFSSYDALEFFELLISVSGVGPKTALNVFGVANIADLKSAIGRGNAALLKKVSGIGAKTAERLVVELKNKISGGPVGKTDDELSSDADAIDALVSLGYEDRLARETLRNVDESIREPGARVKEALKMLKR
ncbi:MAG: Holliday junction branch migration protein RuvA [Parcubacteria group bacterium]